MQYNHGVVDSGNKKLMFFYFPFQEKKIIITLSNEIKLQKLI